VIVSRRAAALASALLLNVGGVVTGMAACSCVAAATAAASGCSSSGSGGGGTPAIQPCSPAADRKSSHGRISVQQAGPGQTVVWGVYATLPAGVYHVTVSVNGVKVDEKTQTYPPHGTIGVKNNAGGLPSGGQFSLTGTFSPPKDDPQEFYLICVLA
jgi:hypothetical protein